jgi:4-hydroxybenzoate polyprenyltransferase
MAAPPPSFRSLLILGRVSNLPTIWSNCLAAWLLNGGGMCLAFLLLLAGATFLYLGGMFLNDAFDAGPDQVYRPERPIPSGRIAARDVWWSGGLFLFFGWLLLFLLGGTVALLALALVGAIIVYNAVHKHTEFAPVFMATCRFLLYLVAGAATFHALRYSLLWHGVALAAYVVGLSLLARHENAPRRRVDFPSLFLAMPVVVALWLQPHRNLLSWLLLAGFVVWLIYCGRDFFGGRKPDVGRTVARLLAGIVLVDAVAVTPVSLGVAIAFLGLFGLALLLQRFVPAT